MRGWPNVANVNAVVSWCCQKTWIIYTQRGSFGAVKSQISERMCLMGVTKEDLLDGF